MCNEKPYRGFYNYETWCIMEWIRYDQDIYEYLYDLAKENLESPSSYGEQISEYFLECADNYALRPKSLFNLLHHAVENANFFEIADMIMSDAKNGLWDDFVSVFR